MYLTLLTLMLSAVKTDTSVAATITLVIDVNLPAGHYSDSLGIHGDHTYPKPSRHIQYKD